MKVLRGREGEVGAGGFEGGEERGGMKRSDVRGDE